MLIEFTSVHDYKEICSPRYAVEKKILKVQVME